MAKINYLKYLIIFSVFASLSNSLGDALKFSGIVDNKQPYDFIWHCIKYFIQIPFWWVAGYFLISYIKQMREIYWYDFWHPHREHYYLFCLLVFNVIVWQFHYKLWRYILITINQ